MRLRGGTEVELVCGLALTDQRPVDSGLSSDRNAVEPARVRHAIALEVADDAEPTSLPTATEWILIDEPVTAMAYALATGTVPNGGDLPKHWHAAADTRWIHRNSYGEFSTNVRLRFENPGRQRAKSFIESEVMASYPAVNAIDGAGRLRWTPIVTPTEESAGQILLDETNCVNTLGLTLHHDKSNVHSSISIEWDWDAQREKFLSRVIYESPDSVIAHATNRTKTYQFKGLHTGVHTRSQIDRMAQTLGDDVFFEKQQLEVESFINGLPLGTLVAVDFPHVRDDAAALGDAVRLKRTMIVTASTLSRKTRTTKYTLTGTLQIAAGAGAGNSLHNLPEREYKEGGTPLSSLPGISINNNVATGNITLQMGRKYYWVDDSDPGAGLEFGSGLNVAFAGAGRHPELWVFGPFLNYSDLNLTAKSDNHGGAGQPSSSTPGVITRPSPGVPGYLGSSAPGGGIKGTAVYRQGLSSNDPYYAFAGRWNIVHKQPPLFSSGLPRIPNIPLSANDGQLRGVPPDLGGSGGPGGMIAQVVDTVRRPSTPGGSTGPTERVSDFVLGRQGGTGGGGLLIVSWGGASYAPITLDGGRAEQPDFAERRGARFYAGEGGPGMQGALLWIVDGNHPAPPLTSSNIKAHSGEPWYLGTIPTTNPSSGNSHRSRHAPTPQVNRWRESARVLYTPESESVQSPSRQLNEIDEAFANQRDGQIALIVQSARPTNSNAGDMWVTQEGVESRNSPPVAEIHRTDGTWSLFERPPDSIVYQLLLDNAYEPDGGDEIISSTTRPDENDHAGDLWHDPNTGAVVRIVVGGPPDELVYAGEGMVGDNLLPDPNFERFANGEPTYYVDVSPDLTLLPTYPVFQNVGGTFIESDSSSGGTATPGFPNLTSVTASPGGTGVAVQLNTPGDTDPVSAYEIRRDGVLIKTIQKGQSTYYVDTTTAPGGQYVYCGRTINQSTDERGSDVCAVRVTATAGSGGGGGSSSVPNVTDIGWVAYSQTSGAVTWNPVNEGEGTGYEVKRDGQVIATYTGRGTSNHQVSGRSPGQTHTWTVTTLDGSDRSTGVTVTGSTNP